MATVGLIPRLASDAAAALAREMVRWLTAHGHQALVEEEAAVAGVPSAPGKDIAARADLLVVLGGDGTLIHAASLCNRCEVPILGVNLGTLGFLTEVPRDRAIPMLEKALRGELPVSRRLMLDVEVRHRDQVLLTPICPHALTQRPVVLPPSSVVQVRVASPSEMFVTLDGTLGRPLELGEEVWIQQAKHRTLILRNPELDHFTILREKLGWGTR